VAENDLQARASYLAGLVKGLDLSHSSPEGRVLQSLAELVVELTRLVGGRRPEPSARAAELPVFLACECPRCGADIFSAVEAVGATRPPRTGRGEWMGRRGTPLQLLRSPASARAGDGATEKADGPAPGQPPRRFEVRCWNCGQVLLVSEKPHA